MCYTENKLEHKTKILTNKNKTKNIKIKKENMADKTIKQDQEFDQEKWRKENGIDYAIYTNEKQYKSPTEVTAENLKRLKRLKKRLENLTAKRQKLAIRH